MGNKVYTMEIAGLKRDLPLCKVHDELYIAAFVMFGDVEITKACATELLKRAPEYDIMITASKLIQSAVDDSGETTKHGANSSLYVVSAKLNANYVLLNNVDENLTLVKNNLQSSVDSLKNVDKTEAAVKALLAQNNLEASYSVLQNALSLSLLNYID